MSSLDTYTRALGQTLKGVTGSPRTPVAVALGFALASAVALLLSVAALLQPAPVVVGTDLVDRSDIQPLRWHWFAAPSRERAEPEPENNEDLALASVRADLLGVVIAAGGSFAAISTPGNPQGVYAVGDSLENNVILEAVERDRVIISQRGSRRQLPLKSLVDGNRRSADRDQLMQLHDVAEGSVEEGSAGQGFQLSGLVSAAPVSVPGYGTGLRLQNLSEDLTALADVREGDVLIAVNGTAIGDMMSNPMLWQQFSQMTTMPVTLIRDDEEIELQVNGASLSAKILPQLGMGRVQ